MSSNSQQVYVIIGASKGIGLEIVTQLASRPSTIIYAGVRSPKSATQLNNLSNSNPNVRIISTDLSDTSSFVSAAEEVKKQVGGIDVLIVNGAQHVSGKAIDGGIEGFQNLFDVNVIGPYRAIIAFLPLLREKKTKKIINVSSSAGSNTLNEGFGPITSTHAAYNVSKGALNSLTRQFATELKADGFSVISVCPGVVKTDMNRSAAKFYPPGTDEAFAHITATPTESASKLISIFDSLTPERNGSFLNHLNEVVPWRNILTAYKLRS